MAIYAESRVGNRPDFNLLIPSDIGWDWVLDSADSVALSTGLADVDEQPRASVQNYVVAQHCGEVSSYRWRNDSSLGRLGGDSQELSTSGLEGGGLGSFEGDSAPTMEQLYDVLGRRQGDKGSAQSRTNARSGLVRLGRAAASWLCERLRGEVDVERHHDVIGVLIEMGHDSRGAIISTLSLSPTELQAESLLSALRWIGIPNDAQHIARQLAARYLEHRSSSVRIAAAKLASVFPRRTVIELLRQARQDECDSDVRDEIDAALES